MLIHQVLMLGQFPRDLNVRSRVDATSGRKDESNLYQRLNRRREFMGSEALPFSKELKQKRVAEWPKVRSRASDVTFLNLKLVESLPDEDS